MCHRVTTERLKLIKNLPYYEPEKTDQKSVLTIFLLLST